MPRDAWRLRTLRASRVQNPPPRCWPKIEDGAAASAPTPDGDASVPPNAGPRADCGHDDAVAARGSPASAQPTPPPHGDRGAQAASQALLSVRELLARLPAPPADPNEWPRSRDRHRVIGEMANRSLPRGPPSGQARRQRWFPQTQHSRPPPRSPALPLRSTATAATWRLRRAFDPLTEGPAGGRATAAPPRPPRARAAPLLRPAPCAGPRSPTGARVEAT
jgi:hypothetical protein